MKKNRIIRSAILLIKFVIVLALILFVSFTVMILYWHFDPGALANIDVTNSFKAGYGFGGLRIFPEPVTPTNEQILLSELSQGMVIWLFVRGTLFFVLSILILRKGLAILQSIGSLRTFYDHNITHFKRIAQYAFLAFFFSCFNFISHQGDTELRLNLAIAPLIFAVGAMVLAEVFKEGKQLLEDQNMII